jgi:hypothetical protein
MLTAEVHGVAAPQEPRFERRDGDDVGVEIVQRGLEALEIRGACEDGRG